MRQIKKWREIQLTYMPGVIATLQEADEDNDEDNEIVVAETIPLILPSGLDPAIREIICLHQVSEHERVLRMAHLQDSLAELRHTRKIRRKLLLNHYMQVAGHGTRSNTRSRTVLNGVENRITKFVERYRVAYKALLQLDPNGDWRETYLELKDSDNRGPGKEDSEKGTGDGSYFRSWIWLSNPRATDTAGGEAGEEGASEEDVNELLRVEWTTSFARLERWTEEVELLQEEMRRVVTFLEWKSADWLAKVDARQGTSTLDIQSGIGAYARKQAAVYHDLAVSFVKLWGPTLKSYDLEHSWLTEYTAHHGISLADANVSVSRRGIFKFRLSKKSRGTTVASAAGSAPPVAKASADNRPLSEEATANDHPILEEATANDHPLLEEAHYSEDNNSEDSNSEDGNSEDSNAGLYFLDDDDDWGW